MKESKNNYAQFGEKLVQLLDARGWHSIPRREMTLSLLHIADKAGIFSLDRPTFELAARLRIPKNTLNGLIRDRALMFSVTESFGYKEFIDWIKDNNQTGHDDAAKGLLICSAAAPRERMQVEAFLEEIGMVPDYKMNRMLLVIGLARLFSLAAKGHAGGDEGLLNALMQNLKLDTERQQKILKKLNQKTLPRLLGDVILEHSTKLAGEATVELFSALFSKALTSINDKKLLP